MRNSLIIFFFLIFSFFACEKQSATEKLDASMNNAKRSAQKAMNRFEEETCVEGDLECLAEKAKNRAEESADYVEDKSGELMDTMD